MWRWIRFPPRDERADNHRLGRIERSILNAIAEAETAQATQMRRAEKARDRAAVLMGTCAAEYMEREEEQERALSLWESDLVAASQRLSTIRRHLEELRLLLTASKLAARQSS